MKRELDLIWVEGRQGTFAEPAGWNAGRNPCTGPGITIARARATIRYKRRGNRGAAHFPGGRFFAVMGGGSKGPSPCLSLGTGARSGRGRLAGAAGVGFRPESKGPLPSRRCREYEG